MCDEATVLELKRHINDCSRLVDSYIDTPIQVEILMLTGQSYQGTFSAFTLVGQLSALLSCPLDQIKFISNGKVLRIFESLIDCNFVNGQKVHIVLRLGCAPDLNKIINFSVLGTTKTLAGPVDLNVEQFNIPLTNENITSPFQGVYRRFTEYVPTVIDCPFILIVTLNSIADDWGNVLYHDSDDYIRSQLSSHISITINGFQIRDEEIVSKKWIDSSRYAIVLSPHNVSSSHAFSCLVTIETISNVPHLTHVGGCHTVRFLLT